MINYIFLFGCLALTSCTSGSTVDQNNVLSFDTTKTFNEYKQEVNFIDANLYTYNTVEKEVNGESAEGGILIGYYDNKNELRKIIGTYYGETGKMFVEYYKKGKHFFYVRSKIFNYRVPIYTDPKGEILSVE